MIECILAPAHIERVAVGQERLAAVRLDVIGHGLGPVGAQESQIARLAKMQLDRSVLLVKIDCAHAGLI